MFNPLAKDMVAKILTKQQMRLVDAPLVINVEHKIRYLVIFHYSFRFKPLKLWRLVTIKQTTQNALRKP
jgi:hypothetical protein